jgi:hypothetical protein
MIYALTKKDVSQQAIDEIKQAIKDRSRDEIQKHVNKGTIIHVMNERDILNPYCIFCGEDVFPTKAQSPRGRKAHRKWHFQHNSNSECIAPQVSAEPEGNPADHGCYIALGCETDENGNHTERHRQECNCKTYCHLASNINERLSPAALLEAAITDFSPCLAAPSQT